MTMRAAQLLSLMVLGAGGLFSTACGDGPQCPSELVLVISSPADGATIAASADLDDSAAGLQTNIDVRSNFGSGSELTLSVTDDTSGAVEQHTATVDGDGEATFANVTLPAGPITLTANGASKCGTATDSSSITVITDGACTLTIDNGPITNDFFAPVPVLNSTNDDSPTLANFQASVTVAAAPGFSVEFFVLDVDANSEASIGTMTADANGDAKFETSLAQGRQILRATCRLDSTIAASASNTVQVDTIVPACTLTNPAVGVTVTPDDDENGDDMDGIQMTWTGTADDAGEGDIEGEAASFSRDTTVFSASALDASGNSSTASGEFTAPGTYEMAFDTTDHAGNICNDSFTANVVMSGCSIVVQQPSGAGTTNGVITADSDSIVANGLQADLTVQVGTECAGQSVFVDCGQGETSAVAPANGTTVVPNVTINPLVSSQGSATCTGRVVSTDGFQTSNQAAIPYDTVAPNTSLQILFPAGALCGTTILRDVSNDSTGTLADGFHIEGRVIAVSSVSREFEVTNASCPTPCVTVAPSFPASVDFLIADGPNDIRAVSRDAVGNQSTSPQCIIRLEDVAVDIVDPVGSGLLGANSPGVTIDGGGDAVTTVCMTTSRNDVVVTLEVVSMTGTTTEPTTFNAGLGQFCTDSITFPEGDYQLSATAIVIADTLQGTDVVDLTVDLTPPTLPGGFTFNASSPNHHDIDADWDAVAGADRYILKFSTTAFTANFANEGTEVTGVGLATSFTIGDLHTDVDYFVGVAIADAAGNISAAATLGGIRPEFDRSPLIVPPDVGTPGAIAPRRFGQQIASGNFNNDAFDDIAIAAPAKDNGADSLVGEVYIYFGSATGIGNTPDVTISGPSPFAFFGWAMKRINWSTGNGDGLAISAVGTNQVFIFHGTTLSSGTSLDTTDANINIVVEGTPNWFTSGDVGTSLAVGELNSNSSVEDLIIGVPFGGGVGGAVVIYGGPPSASNFNITLSDTADATDMAGLEAHIFQNPVTAANNSALGINVAYLGDTRGGDGVGDVAISYFADSGPPQTTDNAIYLLRGRSPSGPSGISFTTLASTTDCVSGIACGDLRIENPSTETSSSYGMEVSSIEDQNGDGFRDLVITGHQQGLGELWIVGGSSVGTVVLNDDTDYLTKISGTSGLQFAAGVANNAETPGADVNGDGVEDLVVTGGTDASSYGVSFFVWYGGRIPVGDALATSADSFIASPTEFRNDAVGGSPNTVQATWAGDVNADGIFDLCWADWQSGTAAEVEGRVEVLWDAQP